MVCSILSLRTQRGRFFVVGDEIRGSAGDNLGQGAWGKGNQQQNVIIRESYESLQRSLDAMQTDMKLLSREVSNLLELKRDLADLRGRLASVADMERDIEKLKTWLVLSFLFLVALGYLYTNIITAPLDARLDAQERQIERMMSWPYVTPTPWSPLP